jgi:hypothetical protein
MFEQPSPSPLLWLVLSWLVAWRVTVMVRYETGPFDVFSWLRLGLARIGAQRLATCFHCTAVWVSAVVVSIVFEWHARSVLLILAVAGAASITERALGEEAQDV